MANPEHLNILKQGIETWNKWRGLNPEIVPDLKNAFLKGADLQEANLKGAKLHGADLRRAELDRADLKGAFLQGAKLAEAFLVETDLSGADMSGADISSRHIHNTIFCGADLSGANFKNAGIEKTNLSGAKLVETNLIGASLKDVNLTSCRVSGISACNLNLDGVTQTNLILSEEGEPDITIDDLEIAHFLSLVINSEKIRDKIRPLTLKLVLILGRFKSERTDILDGIRGVLQKNDYLPVVINFEKQPSQDFIKTIFSLVQMSRFVIADVTDSKIVLEAVSDIVSNLAVPIVPLSMKSTEKELATLHDIRRNHYSLLDAFPYNNLDKLLASLTEKVIVPAEARALELQSEISGPKNIQWSKRHMKRIFISYSRQDRDKIDVLVKELKARGLCLWQDLDDLPLGTPPQEEIREALSANCQGCLIYLTPNSLNSSFVMKVELKEAMEKLNADKAFAIIPVFHGVTVDQVKTSVPTYSGRNVADLNGIIIPTPASPEEIRSKLAEAAQRLLLTVLNNNAAAFLSDPTRKLILDLHTRQYTRGIPEPDLNLDWRNFVNTDDTFDAALCSQILWPALASVEKAVAQALGPRQVLIRALSHLSCGTALGFAFRATTNFQLEIKQGSQVWDTVNIQKMPSPLQTNKIDGDINSDDAAVELSVAQLVTGAVDRFVQQRGQNFRVRAEIKPQKGSKLEVTNSDEANAVAQQAADVIDEIRNDYQPKTVHLFMAVPLALAILIGYRLNARGIIQLYELRNTDQTYVPTFSIV